MATAQLDMWWGLDPCEWQIWKREGFVAASALPSPYDKKVARAVDDIAGRAGMVNFFTSVVWFSSLMASDSGSERDDLWGEVVPPETVARRAPFVYAE